MRKQDCNEPDFEREYRKHHHRSDRENNLRYHERQSNYNSAQIGAASFLP
ncbi:hypothetical protein BURPS406E_P0442 [Burkholderia pseudomallei 406e]|uniref:Uncharacterized protein n=2 Tax=Burkholderia pseudomallei TaxID=28450 RepID=A0A0E1VVE5_BURPE|nr:hypothetical protein BURPS1106A_A0097 [Burkholderia pseudomallei 1106a]AFR18039.1 hypothetical protein BPC006_II0099 [Burkholderia pseudomallei BPC006]EBA47926.1 hypothetical protein BURPS305_3748 [Burkholderia pseudomallei 305]EDO86621.1 hypothetical protein BURPS406E_P0442 [Burkholderia pseudomallei 406e]EDO95353.1 hypothetical protein BURPSPAST_X0008 [Burkholderia pseudomallei Pasteur 52237]EDU10567.1 hypothetical protein BURPS1655_C0693 [Burkholderia pseudomallei 1655]EEC33805.1 conser